MAAGALEQRLSLITLGVADLARARTFYENVVGWKAAAGPADIAFFDLGGIVFSLFPNGELAKDRNATAGEIPDSGFRPFALIKEPEEVFWGGYSGYFADPDGHAWEVAFNPFWTIGDDGRVSMAAGGPD